MSDKLKRIIPILDEISPSMCAAKWLNASIWLSNGRTASCHHPLAHPVPLQELERDPSALHNTNFKKQQRKMMLEGQRPQECGYCWRVEDLKDPDIISDRAHKSMIYTDEQVKQLADLPWDADIDPKTLEICFDNLCNLQCSYCNSEFSSSWASDLATNGGYPDMITSGGRAYERPVQMPYGKNDENPYITKFFEWYHRSLRNNLTELRISGGEPSRSPHFWRLVESFDNEQFEFAVNSNLMMEQPRLQQLAKIANKFPPHKFHLYTSMESHGLHANFVRAGVSYNEWLWNLSMFQAMAPKAVTHVMMTISALSIWTVDEFMMDIQRLRTTHPHSFHLSVNILRFPSFQSVNILPVDIKLKLANKIETVLSNNQFSEFEVAGFKRLSEYLRQVDVSYEDRDMMEHKLHDFKNFVV